MAGFQINFDATKVKPSTGAFTVLEAGEYIVHIVSSDEKPAKSTPGATFVEVVMQVLDGPNKGDRLIDRLNLKNPNQQAVDIAYGTLSAMCYVTGQIQIQNTMQLHGKPFKVDVKKIPRNDKPEQMTNEIARYMDINGNAPGAGADAPGAGMVGGVAPQAAHVAQQASVAQPSIAQQAQAAAGVAQTPAFTAQQAGVAPAAGGNAAPSWAQ